MASVKVKFRPSTIEGKEGTIYYQIIQNRVIRQLKTDYRIFTDEWNEAGSCIIVGCSERSNLLLFLQERMEWDLKRLDMIVHQLENRKGTYTADDIVTSFQSNTEGQSLFNFMQGIIARLKQMGKIRTAENYSCTLKSFMQFRGDRDVLLSEIDSDLMQLYEAYLHGKGAVRNTSSFYMRILRAVYNRALEKELMEQRNPFRHVYTGVDKTVKRAIPISRVRTLANMEFITKGKERRSMEYARDMFMLSFYFRGMSFIDMAFLKKTDIQQGTVIYRRHKTGQRLFIKIEPPMRDIMKRIGGGEDSPYVLDVIRREGKERDDVRAANSRINKALHKIGRLIGVDNLTMYVARHSWASACKASNIPISVISEGMGHDSEETTRIYLAQLDTSVVDKANRKIINQII